MSSVLGSAETSFNKCETRLHEDDHGCAHDDPKKVAGLDRMICSLGNSLKIGDWCFLGKSLSKSVAAERKQRACTDNRAYSKTLGVQRNPPSSWGRNGRVDD